MIQEALPPQDTASDALLCQLDRASLHDYLSQQIGAMPTWCKRWLDCYCLSTFAGRSDEVSAAQGMAFLQADLAGIGIFPGGNGSITQALLSKLSKQANLSLRKRSLVRAIDIHPNYVDVLYHNAHDQLQRLRAPTCLLAVPKFIAKRLVPQLPTTQLAAMAKIEYRAYVVANVALPKQAALPAYDGFWLQESQEQPIFQDIIDGAYGQSPHAKQTTYTLYCPMPAAQARVNLLQPSQSEVQRTAIRQQLAKLLASYNLSPDTIEHIHLTRWGHALPLPAPGLLAQRVLPTAHQSYQDSLFFSQQDNWCAPAFEAIYAESSKQAAAIRRVLTT